MGIILIFLFSVAILTLLEFLGGHLIHLLTGKVFWDYSDLKFNLKEHPNANRTPIGGGKTYQHGNVDNSTGSISFNLDDIDLSKENIIDIPIKEVEYDLLSNEELDNYIEELEKNTEDKNNEDNK